MRWWGSTPSASPGIDGGRTAVLEPHELDDEYFMLRVRIDGGALTRRAAARHRATSRAAFARDTADLTDRQNIQLHWIRIEDVPAIWRRLEAVGLETTEACGDCPARRARQPGRRASRPTRSSTPRRPIDEIKSALHRRRRSSPTCRASSRPRSRAASQRRRHEINDISFVGVEHPELGPGFDLWVGGGLSTNPRLAERLGVLGAAGRGPGRLGGRRRGSSATTATGGCGTAPG